MCCDVAKKSRARQPAHAIGHRGRESEKCTVRAIKSSIVVPIDERRFLFMVQQTPFFALRLMRVMTAWLRAMNERAKAAE
jgi:CRP-like cAMP-binding protein